MPATEPRLCSCCGRKTRKPDGRCFGCRRGDCRACRPAAPRRCARCERVLHGHHDRATCSLCHAADLRKAKAKPAPPPCPACGRAMKPADHERCHSCRTERATGLATNGRIAWLAFLASRNLPLFVARAER